jgi:hypothetical protein
MAAFSCLIDIDCVEWNRRMGMAENLDEWLLMVDGAARGNPGEAGCGAVIFSPMAASLRS